MRLTNKLQLGLIALTTLVSLNASAQSKPSPQAQDAKADKVDVSDLEKKYWASKDTDFSVVQNRLYTKAKRFSLSATAGPVVAEDYTSGLVYSLDASYYFNERWGIAGTYSDFDVKQNDSVNDLENRYGVRPDFNIQDGFYGVSALWVPIYAKASFLNSKIVYFDFTIAPGVGMMSYSQIRETGNVKKSAPALSIDFTQQMFFSKHFALRADYRHRFYNEEIVNWRVPTTGSSTTNNTMHHSQSLTFGFTFFF